MLNQEEQIKLRNRFNPEGSLLRQHQLRMLDILIEIDKICQKHNINYWIDGGTLLGAVRHGGFIPWDDDIDIAVMHNEYTKLLKILSKELPSNLKVQTPLTDKHYYSPFAKVRDLNSEIVEKGSYPYQYNGIFIDIFPIHKANKTLAKMSGRLTDRYLLSTTYRNNPAEPIRRKNILIRFFCFKILNLLFSLVNQLVKHNYLNYYWGTYYSLNCPKEDIVPVTKILFENHYFNAPRNYCTVLKYQFGNYEELPNLDNLHTHILSVKFK